MRRRRRRRPARALTLAQARQRYAAGKPLPLRGVVLCVRRWKQPPTPTPAHPLNPPPGNRLHHGGCAGTSRCYALWPRRCLCLAARAAWSAEGWVGAALPGGSWLVQSLHTRQWEAHVLLLTTPPLPAPAPAVCCGAKHRPRQRRPPDAPEHCPAGPGGGGPRAGGGGGGGGLAGRGCECWLVFSGSKLLGADAFPGARSVCVEAGMRATSCMHPACLPPLPPMLPPRWRSRARGWEWRPQTCSSARPRWVHW